MGLEIERKFLLRTDSWRTLSTKAISIQQGYLCVEPARTVRVRTWNNDGKITVKGASHNGIRTEFEYSIPVQEAREMIRDLCLPVLPLALCVDKELIRRLISDGWELARAGDLLELLVEYLAVVQLQQTSERPAHGPDVDLLHVLRRQENLGLDQGPQDLVDDFEARVEVDPVGAEHDGRAQAIDALEHRRRVLQNELLEQFALLLALQIDP